MKNIVLKLIIICLCCGYYAVFVAWENGGFSQLHDFQAIENNGMSAYLHQTSAASMQAEKNELSILQNNQNSLASCVGIESLCEHAKPGIWVEHAKFLQHKDTGKLLVLSLDYLENNNTAKTLQNRYSASLLPQADRTEVWHYAWRTFLRSVTFLLLFNLLSMIFALFEKKQAQHKNMPSEHIFRRHVSLLKLNADEPYRQERPIRQTLRLSTSPVQWRFRATIYRFYRRFWRLWRRFRNRFCGLTQ